MKTITSRQNPIVDAFRELADAPDPSGRRLLLDGVHLVREAAAAKLDFEVAAITPAHLDAATEEAAVADALRADGIELLTVSEQVLAAMSPVRTPSGLVAIVRRPASTPSQLFEPRNAFVLIVIDVQDPGNLGALVRAAEAGGATGVMVCGASANPYGWKAIRGSMGSALRLPVVGGLAVDEALATVRQAGARMIAAVARAGDDPDAINWSGRIALLLGGEGPGLTESVIQESDSRVTIPMASPVESLNVAAAGAILIYAARRQRQ